MAVIFCFTSTGNSLFTAERLAKKINGDVKPMNTGIKETEDDVIGFVFPIYFWGLPRMVERFVSGLQIANKKAYIFAVATCGGTDFGALAQLNKLLQKKGVRLQYGTKLLSVSNYLPEYLPNDSEELRKKIDVRIMEIGDEIESGQSNRVSGFTALNKIASRFYPGESSDQEFTIAPTCTGCGTCKKVCPAQNITIEAGRPEFLHKCEHCLACLHHCPARAVDWKQKTEGKDRYRNAGVSLDELISFQCGKDI